MIVNNFYIRLDTMRLWLFAPHVHLPYSFNTSPITSPIVHPLPKLLAKPIICTGHLLLLGQVVDLLDFLEVRFVVKFEILQEAILEAKHPSVHDGELILSPALLHGCRFDYVPALLDDIQLNEAIVLLVLVCDACQLILVESVDVANVSEPWVQDA